MKKCSWCLAEFDHEPFLDDHGRIHCSTEHRRQRALRELGRVRVPRREFAKARRW